MTDESGTTRTFWQNNVIALIVVVLVLGVTLLMPGVGVIPAFVIALAAALVGRKAGSFRDMGMRAPDSWLKLLSTTFAYGVAIQSLFTMVLEPLLERMLGSTIDISVLDPVRGNVLNFLFLLAVGWIMGGFLEEFTFRGFVVTRVRKLMGDSPAAVLIAILAAAIPFGLAHAYQGPAGMIATGLVGFVFGVMFVLHDYNLWYPVFAHGFINTIAITLVYLDLDRALSDFLF